MALPTSGPLLLSQIQTEFGGTNPVYLSEYYAGGAHVPTGTTGTNGPVPSSGSIKMFNFYGTSSAPPVSSLIISTNEADLNLRTWALANGWDGSSFAEITVAPGVYVYSTNTANAGMTIDGSWPNGVTLINNGYIIGNGGTGPTFTYPATQVGLPGTAGGPAMSISVPVTVDNTNPSAYIAGGGGSGATSTKSGAGAGGGGGAGGGTGGTIVDGTAVPPGIGGSVGNSGSDGTQRPGGGGYPYVSGGGGGRILPGVGGPAVSGGANIYGRGGGAGGSGGYGYNQESLFAAISGGGGGWGAAGGTCYWATGFPSASYLPSYGGGGSANGEAVPPNLARPNLAARALAVGGLGGNAVVLNGNSITWVSGDTTRVWGAVS